jgi:hypothetical protein
MIAKLCLGLACALLLGACATPHQTAALLQNVPPGLQQPVVVANVPFFPQDAYQCGPAALATLLAASELAVTPEQLVPLVYVPGRQGSFQVELVAAARSFGRLAYRIAPTLEALFTEVAAGHPVLVLQNLGIDWIPRWHFAVVKGFDVQSRTVLLNSGVHENYPTALATFERTWARAEHWAIVALQPPAMPATAEPAPYFSALVAMEQSNAPELVEKGYASGLAAWPTDRNLLMGYGNLLYAQGSANAAMERFRAVVRHHPDYAPALNNLAQILYEQGELEQALDYARQAVALGGIYLETYQSTLDTIQAAAD